ncbi:hypothetical protein [Helicobacter zhangjianzhongii]|uniref:Uncharacterized protein n=1 Tax=Helicobacter zhangjianzhongii TaxID=2974574 RepID=A0ACC6FPF6_9HELI|nr:MULTISPECIES: hypothetical protein [unclassified Helicobacter]MDL0079068.1 hypothetical protein [Helicobacter sp. CPD2-1]MDL0081094.1 hypothetical protein [Helicobacter sp. XJK30-2]
MKTPIFLSLRALPLGKARQSIFALESALLVCGSPRSFHSLAMTIGWYGTRLAMTIKGVAPRIHFF